ncbi:MAG: ComEC/Rec2 family competence protein [Sphaerochaetaceae bacterium]
MGAATFIAAFISIFLCAGILRPRPWMLLALVALSGISSAALTFSRQRMASLARLMALSLCLLQALAISPCSRPCLSQEAASCTRIRGRLLEDSRLTSTGWTFFSLALQGSYDQNGDRLDARGLCPAICRSYGLVSHGTELEMEGSFSDGLFIASSFKALSSPGELSEQRLRLISAIEKRLSPDEPRNLALMLLLGRSQQPSQVSDLAKQAGSSHILALSGMHLGFFTGLAALILRKRGRILGIVLCLAFLWLAGPKPSLLRSVIMLCLPLKGLDCLLGALILQEAINPLSLCSLGGLYSYLAMLGLVGLLRYVNGVLKTFMPLWLSSILSSSLAALLASAAASLALEGSFRPQALLVSYLGGLLAFSVMAVGILYLLFPLSWLDWLLQICCKAMKGLFGWASAFKPAGLCTYIVCCAVLLTLLGLLGYSRRRMNRRREAYELGFRLRFSNCNQSLASSPWAESYQEIRPELPPVPTSGGNACPGSGQGEQGMGDRSWNWDLDEGAS